MICVFGATGRIGREVCNLLDQMQISYRAVSRDMTRAKAIVNAFPNKAGVPMAANMSEPGSVRAALHGASSVFLITEFSEGQTRLQKLVVDIALQSGVSRLVKVATMHRLVGQHSPVGVGRSHWEVEEYIRSRKLAYTFLHPTYFMQNLLDQAAPAIASGRPILLPFANSTRIAMIDCRDIAAVAVEALIHDGHAQKTYELTGPEAITFSELAQLATQIYGKRVRYRAAPEWLAKIALRFKKPNQWERVHLSGMIHEVNAGCANSVSPVFFKLMKRPAISISQFLVDYRLQMLGSASR